MLVRSKMSLDLKGILSKLQSTKKGAKSSDQGYTRSKNEELVEKYRKMDLAQLGQMIQGTGKHQGETLDALVKDPERASYLRWVAMHQAENPSFLALLTLIERQEQPIIVEPLSTKKPNQSVNKPGKSSSDVPKNEEMENMPTIEKP